MTLDTFKARQSSTALLAVNHLAVIDRRGRVVIRTRSRRWASLRARLSPDAQVIAVGGIPARKEHASA